MKSSESPKKYYIYAHIRNDNGEIFYIGKGMGKRAKALDGRNPLWQNVVKKAGGYKVEIIATCNTEKYAFLLEKILIKHYGRRDNGTGILVNMTDGGEGVSGAIVGGETRKKLSILASKPRSEAWIKSIRIARKNGGNGGVVKKGDRLSEEWKNKIAISKLGEKNPMFGKTGIESPSARQVVDIENHLKYGSVSEAAEKNGYKMKTLYNWLSGFRPNPTNLRFQIYGRS